IPGLYERMPGSLNEDGALADKLDECTSILWQSFVSDQWTSPTLVRDSYRRYVDVLRLIGAREAHKRWLLKAPYHMTCIDTVFEVFPDACVIQTHRDPVKSIPSLCSLLAPVVPAARHAMLGRERCAYWRKALDRMQVASRERPTQFFHVDHRRF